MDAFSRRLRNDTLSAAADWRNRMSAPDIPFVDLRSDDGAQTILDLLHAAGAGNIGLVIGKQTGHSYAEADKSYCAFVDVPSPLTLAKLCLTRSRSRKRSLIRPTPG